ncbi:TPA: ead/Ea22-like family protein [Klebsiella pneumoniae]|uniref:ead/Ea22-like family protein n=1 Tax=Klebsiella michiganensis TaxID=1134687 RepID=UPI002E7AC61B|nr:ead/Ea22-like family protein [Klebsiella michiganensis]MEE1967610.1 ead/Ea22-like family protein [Klebsiella michiganensis]HCJ3179691.1 ead/Ea22-like family protein [Klebsiella pneumoniae]
MTTDITELAQRMKAAAEKLDADQWQTRKGFSGIEVIVKGSLEKGAGCVSFQPVAADIADTKTARAIALFSPANILALVEALEKAQQHIARQEQILLNQDESLSIRRSELEKAQDQSSKWLEAYHKAVSIGARYEERIAELESRTVTIKFTPIPVEELGNVRDGKKHPYMFGAGYNAAVIHCESVIQQELDAKGIKWEAE